MSKFYSVESDQICWIWSEERIEDGDESMILNPEMIYCDEWHMAQVQQVLEYRTGFATRVISW